MRPDKNMKRVVNGQRYNVATATMLAHNEYWDGSNFERAGRNTFLYRTRGGAYFRVVCTQWEGERDTLIPIDMDDAKSLYETLREHVVDYEQAFDAVVDEATSGRPTHFGEPMRQTALWLPEEMITWLKDQPVTMSETIRELIKKEMGK